MPNLVSGPRSLPSLSQRPQCPNQIAAKGTTIVALDPAIETLKRLEAAAAQAAAAPQPQPPRN